MIQRRSCVTPSELADDVAATVFRELFTEKQRKKFIATVIKRLDDRSVIRLNDPPPHVWREALALFASRTLVGE